MSLVLAIASSARFNVEEALGIWLFDEGEGDEVEDFSGHGNDGKFINEPKWVDGKFGQALSFDGDDYVEINSPVNITEMNYSISVWVNPGDSQKTYANILGNHTEPCTGYVVQQNADGLNSFYSAFGGGGAWDSVTACTQLKSGVWQHFVTVREDASMTHYLSGKESASQKVSKVNVTPSVNNLLIGEWVAGKGRQFNGMIDEVLIIDRVLTMDEISALSQGVEKASAISNTGKLTATWGDIKRTDEN
jgi:hypothetical protein